jgi:hypothetical protein
MNDMKKTECGFFADTLAYQILLTDSVSLSIQMMLQTLDIAIGGLSEDMLKKVRSKIIKDFTAQGWAGADRIVDSVIACTQKVDDDGVIHFDGFLYEQ